MYKSALFFALSASLVSNSFAFDILPGVAIPTKHAVKNITKKHTTLRKYTDFSGSWHGFCVVGDESQPTILEIKNDKDSIELNGQHFYINSFNTQSAAEKDGIDFTHTQFTWAAQGNSLIMNSIGVLQEFESDQRVSSLASSFTKLTFTLNNNKLELHGNTSYQTDSSEAAWQDNFDCSLEKS